MSSPKIFSGIHKIVILVFAGVAVALAAAPPGTKAAVPPGTMAAAPAPAAGRPAGHVHPATAAVGGHPVPASLAIRIVPATARPARYTLTVHAARARFLRPRQIAWRMLQHFSWEGWQFRYLNRLWDHESSWNTEAANPYSGAYGIPQAVPGSKMASAGLDWRWSARTQIRWGLRYIRERYGCPWAAWRHELWYGWY